MNAAKTHKTLQRPPCRAHQSGNGSQRGCQNEETPFPSGRMGSWTGTQGLTLRMRSRSARFGRRPGPLTRRTGQEASPPPREGTRATDGPTAVSRISLPSPRNQRKQGWRPIQITRTQAFAGPDVPRMMALNPIETLSGQTGHNAWSSSCPWPFEIFTTYWWQNI